MKTNASSTASALGIKRCIFPCEVGTKITYGGSNFQLSMHKLHMRDQQLFFYLLAMKFTLVLLSKVLSKIRYSKSWILYNITYTTIEALLYQPLRFIFTLKSNRSIISFGRKHCKYDMHYNFHASFLGIAFKSFIDGKEYCTKCLYEQLTLVCLYKSVPSTCFVLLYKFLFMCNAFVFCLKKQDIF